MTRFSKTRQPPNEHKRKKKRKTIIREQLGLKNIEGLEGDVLKVWKRLIGSKSNKYSSLAAKEISKYLFPQKKETVLKFNGTIKFVANNKIVPPLNDGND